MTQPFRPKPPRHVKITFSGTLGLFQDPVEIFVFGVAMRVDALGPTSGELLAMAGAARAAFTAHLASNVGPDARVTRTRCAVISDQGLTERGASGAFNHQDDNTVAPGIAGGAATPGVYQVSHAISLTTVVPGAVGRGRFFLPLPARAPTVTGQLTEADAGFVAGKARDFINALNTAGAANGMPAVVIASGGSVTKNIPPALYNVTGVNVGRRLDIIRSRANAVDEGYQYRGLVA